MSYLYDNGINYGDDEVTAVPGETYGMVREFNRMKVIRPEDMALAENYNISLNPTMLNRRSDWTYAPDRYEVQTVNDIKLNSKRLPNGKCNPNLPVADYELDNGIKPGVLDKGMKDKWQPQYNGIVGPTDGQFPVKFIPEHFNSDYIHKPVGQMSGEDLLNILLFIVLVIVLVYNTMMIQRLKYKIKSMKRAAAV